MRHTEDMTTNQTAGGTATYYHVADSTYELGDDLMSRSELVECGMAPAWHWEDSEEGTHSEVVCLLAPESLDDDVAGAAWMLAEFPGSRLLRVDLPDDWPMTTITEGYEPYTMTFPASTVRIPSAYITIVR